MHALLQRIRRNRRGSLEWITPQLLVGIVVVGILLVVIYALGAKIYGSLFGGENQRLMTIQFETFTQRIDDMVKSEQDFSTDFMVFQQPDNGGYFIVGFDTGQQNADVRYYLQNDYTKLVTGTLTRSTSCGTSLDACICLYNTDGKKAIESKQVPKPLECVKYPVLSNNKIIFSSRVQAFQKTASRLVAWTDKSSTSDAFKTYQPYQDYSVHDPLDYGAYYKSLVISHSDDTPSKTFYLEKSTWFARKNPNDPKSPLDPSTKATFIFVQDYGFSLKNTLSMDKFDFSDTIKKRQNAFHLCALPTSAASTNDCSYRHVGDIYQYLATVWYECQTTADGCQPVQVPLCSDPSIGCLTGTAANPVTITRPCLSYPTGTTSSIGIHILTEGTCYISSPGASTYAYTYPRCGGDITKPCICSSDLANTQTSVTGYCGVNIGIDIFNSQGSWTSATSQYSTEGDGSADTEGVLLPSATKGWSFF